MVLGYLSLGVLQLSPAFRGEICTVTGRYQPILKIRISLYSVCSIFTITLHFCRFYRILLDDGHLLLDERDKHQYLSLNWVSIFCSSSWTLFMFNCALFKSLVSIYMNAKSNLNHEYLITVKDIFLIIERIYFDTLDLNNKTKFDDVGLYCGRWMRRFPVQFPVGPMWKITISKLVLVWELVIDCMIFWHIIKKV